MNYEFKTFQLVLNMLKFNLQGNLNFERLFSSFKEPSNRKTIMERKILGGEVGRGRH
jgi:hypothetical protein